MSRGDGEPIHAAHGSNGRVARLTVPAVAAEDVEYVDEALDDLVSTVDDLVRDLATPREDAEEVRLAEDDWFDAVHVRPAPEPPLSVVTRRPSPPPTPKKLTTRFVVAALVVAVVVEFLILYAMLGRA